jgi:hypothetical protein
MWPATPADDNALHSGIAHVAFDHENSSAPAISSFRGSIPHPNSCVRFVFGVATASRNTRFQAAGSDLHRLIAPALPGAFRHSITSSARPRSGSGTVMPRSFAVLRFQDEHILVREVLGADSQRLRGRRVAERPFVMRAIEDGRYGALEIRRPIQPPMLLWPKPLDLRLERGFDRPVRRLNGDHARSGIGDTASLADALDLRTLLREFASAQD